MSTCCRYAIGTHTSRPAEFRRTPEEIAAVRDRLMIEILKLHKKQ